jgi:hypothetical protein
VRCPRVVGGPDHAFARSIRAGPGRQLRALRSSPIKGDIMTTGQLLLNLGILAFVLRTGLGTRPLTRRRFTLPIAIVAAVGFTFLRTVPTSGNDVSLDVVLGLAGIALGVLAGSLMAVYRDRSDGSLVTRAGAAYAAVWTAVIAGRILFAYGSNHWFAPQIVSFSRGHALTGSAAWTAAFVIMAVSMVVARVAVTAIKAERSNVPHHPADLSHVGAW